MKKEILPERRNRILSVALTQTEYLQLKEECSRVPGGRLSEHSRRKLLGRPVVFLQRNQSLDELIPLLAGIRQEFLLLGEWLRDSELKSRILDPVSELHWREGQWSREKDRVQELLEKMELTLYQISTQWLPL